MYIPRKRQFWSVAVGHLTNDIFMSAGIVVLTFLSATILPMSNTQIGFAVSMQQLSGAFTQPFFGLRADKTGGRGIGAGGLAWVVVSFLLAILLAITTRNYWLMLIPFVLQGIGSGALHPVGALHASDSEPERAATSTAYFFLMGQVGLAVGPTLVGLLLDGANVGSLVAYGDWFGFPAGDSFNANLLPLFVMGIFAIPSIIFMFGGIPIKKQLQDDLSLSDVSKQKAKKAARRVTSWTPFLVIGLLVILRGLAQPGSVNFIPVLFQQKGWTASQYGAITSSFWIASAIMGVVFGNLADKYDRRYVVLASLSLSAPAYFFLPILNGAGAFALAIIAGGLSGGSHSIIVVLAQELIPDSKGFASGAILGFIFGTGALGSLVIGVVSDQIGLAATFQFVAVAVFMAGFIALFLPKRAIVSDVDANQDIVE
ncbi:MAG: MFS transporter [Phototrophicaceae bacterium]